MTKLNKSFIPALVLILSSAILTTNFVYARAENTMPIKEDEESSPREDWREKQEQLKEKREGIREDMVEKKEEFQEKRQERACDLRSMRINNRIKMMEATERFHVKRYEFFVTRLENLLEKIDGKGYDTTKVEADLTELNEKTSDLKKMWDELIQKLTDMKDLDCTNLDEPQTNLTQELKDDLAAVKEKAEEIKTYIQETVKEDLKALRDEIKADRAESEKDEMSEETEE